MRLDGDEVREKVASAECQVLDDEIKRIVGVLDTRDGNVSNLHDVLARRGTYLAIGTYAINDRRQDDLADVHPKLRLELEAALVVEEQVFRETCPIVAKAIQCISVVIASRVWSRGAYRWLRGSSPNAVNQSVKLPSRLSKWPLYLPS